MCGKIRFTPPSRMIFEYNLEPDRHYFQWHRANECGCIRRLIGLHSLSWSQMIPKHHLFLKERALPFQLLLLLPLPSVASTSKKLNAGEFAGRDTKKTDMIVRDWVTYSTLLNCIALQGVIYNVQTLYSFTNHMFQCNSVVRLKFWGMR